MNTTYISKLTYRKALIGIALTIFAWPSYVSAQKIEFSSQAISWADSVYNLLSLEQKISQLFIADARYDSSIILINNLTNQPGFILGAKSTTALKLLTLPANLEPIVIPDISSGFETTITGLPFPDEKTLAFMDAKNQAGLLVHLNKWLVANKYNAFLASGNYVFNNGSPRINGKTIILPVAKSANENLQAFILKIHDTPTPLIESMPTLELKDFSNINDFKKIDESFFEWRASDSEKSIELLLQKGNVFFTNDFNFDFNRILLAINGNWLNFESFESACKHILAFKFELQQQKLINEIVKPANSAETELRWGYENAIGIFQPQTRQLLPLISLDLNVGYLTDGNGYFEEFKSMASNYIHNNNVAKDPSEYNLVFWLIGPTFNFDNSAEAKILEIKSRFPQASLVMVKTGDVADLPFVEMPSGLDALVVSPSNLPFTWSALAQAVFSGINVNSKHNNTNIPKPLNQSSLSLTATRLKYGIPEEVGLISDSLMLINGIVEDAIRKTAIPGAQVLVAKNGVVVFNKNFGWVTYDKNRMVTGDIIYDLASITKVMATLPVLMQQYDRGSWHLNNKLSDFIPEADTTDKGKITMRQLLLHESGLPAFISFYIEAIDRTKLSGTLFSNRRSPTHTLRLEDRLFLNKSVAYRDDVFQAQHDLKFSVPVAKNLFMNVFYQDSMFYRILKSKTDLVVKYRYSDLNFMLLQRISENITKESLEVQANINFYKPIGASSLCFNPWKTIPLDQVAPTENDQVFRHQLLHGYVHDPGAAMMGGIAGHAGLFGNASDLAKMAQMYLNNGVYGGARFINEETMMLFTSQQNQANRRGLGFDKPENIPENNSSVTQLVSPLSYGHTGFSGTIVWIDPEYDLIFIFLSNRIHPNSYNKKILELGIRPRVQRAVYQSIKDRIPTN